MLSPIILRSCLLNWWRCVLLEHNITKIYSTREIIRIVECFDFIKLPVNNYDILLRFQTHCKCCIFYTIVNNNYFLLLTIDNMFRIMGSEIFLFPTGRFGFIQDALRIHIGSISVWLRYEDAYAIFCGVALYLAFTVTEFCVILIAACRMLSNNNQILN